ncbi:hypothetical protein ACQ4LE_009175 [Meloidogyne hapla]
MFPCLHPSTTTLSSHFPPGVQSNMQHIRILSSTNREDQSTTSAVSRLLNQPTAMTGVPVDTGKPVDWVPSLLSNVNSLSPAPSESELHWKQAANTTREFAFSLTIVPYALNRANPNATTLDT